MCLQITGQFSLQAESFTSFRKKEKNERQRYKDEENGNTAVLCQI